MKLHERLGHIVGRTHATSRAIVQFDDPTKCCDHPDCEAPGKRQSEITFGLLPRDERAAIGARVRTYWMRGDTVGGLAGEVI